VGIFNGLFQVTAVTQGIDLFIYIVSALVLLISETQVLKYQLNNEEPASSQERAGSSNVFLVVQSIGWLGRKRPALPRSLLNSQFLLKYLKSIGWGGSAPHYFLSIC
jgi:hypothetical protein